VSLELIAAATAAGARRAPACELLGLSVRTVERWQRQGEGGDRRAGPRREPANKLSPVERRQVLALASAPEYRDLSPQQIVPRLADLGRYVASESTFYRLLRAEEQMTHRARWRPATQRRPREHVATGPCQVWSWDITYLRSAVRGQFFYLYLIEDVWSRKIVGYAVHGEESMEHAAALMLSTCATLGIDPEGLVLHSDNGGPMKGSTMLATLQRLGVVASFSRPRVSDDNSFSEALFRTLKYRPEFPSRPFAAIEDARGWVEGFVRWYNTEHRHSAIRFVTPEQRHSGQEPAILAHRRRIYEAARRRHPQRWPGAIRNWNPVAEVRLNPERLEQGHREERQAA
jgi:putative transposase